MINRWKIERIEKILKAEAKHCFEAGRTLHKILDPVSDTVLLDLLNLPYSHPRHIATSHEELFRAFTGKNFFRQDIVTGEIEAKRAWEVDFDIQGWPDDTPIHFRKDDLITWLQRNSDLLPEFRSDVEDAYLSLQEIQSEPIPCTKQPGPEIATSNKSTYLKIISMYLGDTDISSREAVGAYRIKLENSGIKMDEKTIREMFGQVQELRKKWKRDF